MTQVDEVAHIEEDRLRHSKTCVGLGDISVVDNTLLLVVTRLASADIRRAILVVLCVYSSGPP